MGPWLGGHRLWSWIWMDYGELAAQRLLELSPFFPG